MADYTALLASLIALLLGLTIGKAWERYKLRDGRWVDRRRARESPHYILGLNFLVSNQLDLAIEELSRAAQLLGDALEIELILGNLYREKGQVGRAINIHQGLLQRPKLTKLEHAYALLCLGLDYKRGGFVNRALQAFNEVLRLDKNNRHALIDLEKLHEEQHQWREAYAIRQRLMDTQDAEEGPRNQTILAFLENQIGLEALKAGDTSTAIQRFEAAIDLDVRTTPAHLNLGDRHLAQGLVSRAITDWERLIEVAPERAYLAFDRLESAFGRANAPEQFEKLCRRLIAANPQDWRARLALAGSLLKQGKPAEALELLFEAIVHNPHGLAIHEAIWRTLSKLDLNPALVGRYVELAERAVFYLDPHVCVRCRYRSTELLWQCPHCHEWNTFVEERIAPAEEPNEPNA